MQKDTIKKMTTCSVIALYSCRQNTTGITLKIIILDKIDLQCISSTFSDYCIILLIH